MISVIIEVMSIDKIKYLEIIRNMFKREININEAIEREDTSFKVGIHFQVMNKKCNALNKLLFFFIKEKCVKRLKLNNILCSSFDN